MTTSLCFFALSSFLLLCSLSLSSVHSHTNHFLPPYIIPSCQLLFGPSVSSIPNILNPLLDIWDQFDNHHAPGETIFNNCGLIKVNDCMELIFAVAFVHPNADEIFNCHLFVTKNVGQPAADNMLRLLSLVLKQKGFKPEDIEDHKTQPCGGWKFDFSNEALTYKISNRDEISNRDWVQLSKEIYSQSNPLGDTLYETIARDELEKQGRPLVAHNIKLRELGQNQLALSTNDNNNNRQNHNALTRGKSSTPHTPSPSSSPSSALLSMDGFPHHLIPSCHLLFGPSVSPNSAIISLSTQWEQHDTNHKKGQNIFISSGLTDRDTDCMDLVFAASSTFTPSDRENMERNDCRLFITNHVGRRAADNMRRLLSLTLTEKGFSADEITKYDDTPCALWKGGFSDSALTYNVRKDKWQSLQDDIEEKKRKNPFGDKIFERIARGERWVKSIITFNHNLRDDKLAVRNPMVQLASTPRNNNNNNNINPNGNQKGNENGKGKGKKPIPNRIPNKSKMIVKKK